MEVIKPWITQKVTSLLGFEDDVLINFVFGMLEEQQVKQKNLIWFGYANSCRLLQFFFFFPFFGSVYICPVDSLHDLHPYMNSNLCVVPGPQGDADQSDRLSREGCCGFPQGALEPSSQVHMSYLCVNSGSGYPCAFCASRCCSDYRLHSASGCARVHVWSHCAQCAGVGGWHSADPSRKEEGRTPTQEGTFWSLYLRLWVRVCTFTSCTSCGTGRRKESSGSHPEVRRRLPACSCRRCGLAQETV